MQSSSRSLPFKQTLAGASPATDAIPTRNSERGARNELSQRPSHLIPRSEFRNPRFSAPVPQQLQDEFCKLEFVGASPTRGSISNQDCGVTAASLPVKETVRVRIPAS